MPAQPPDPLTLVPQNAGPRRTIAALVVTHNRLDKLRVTVARLLAEDLDRVLVFDNNSGDGTAEWLASLSERRLIVIHNPDNIGGAGGFSRGVRYLAEQVDPDWIVVMDDDGRPVPGCIDTFRNLPPHDWDAVGAAVLTPAGDICEMNRPYRNPFWHLPEFLRTLVGGGRRGFHLPDTAYRADAPPVAIDMASFVGLFLSRRAIAQAGYPDERLFIYGDDQLYTLTLRRAGGRLGFLPRIRFEHDTASIQADGRLLLNPIWKVYYNYRNAILAYRVAAGLWFWPLLPVLLVKWRLRGRDYGDQRAAFGAALSQAIRDGLTGRLDRSHDEIMALAGGRTTAGEHAPRNDTGDGQ